MVPKQARAPKRWPLTRAPPPLPPRAGAGVTTSDHKPVAAVLSVALPDGAMEKPNFVYATLAPTPSLTLTLTLTRLLRVRRSPELAPHARSSAS